MYNYDFKNEKAIYENRNVIVDIDDVDYILAIIITNKNLLLFNDANKNNILKGRGILLPPDYILELQIPIAKLKYVCEEGNTYIDYNKKTITLYNFELTKII